MENAKSPKNKTINLSVKNNEGKQLLSKCLFSDCKDFSLKNITNKIILGNSLEICKKLPESFVDLLIADPPYNIDKSFNGYNFYKMTYEKYANYTEEWILAVKPLLKPNASIYVCCDWKSSSAIENVLHKYFFVQNRITWQREKGRGAKHNWKNSMEDIWFCTLKDSDFTFNTESVKQRRKVIAPYKENGKPKDWTETENGKFRDTFPSNFWDDISVPYWSMSENTAHPTQKPEKLLAKLILASSNKGDFVFDPFMGSGSTAVTSFKLNRNFCGVEMNEQYCVWAQKRLEMAKENKTIQGYANGVFWERNTSNFQKNAK